MSFDHFKLIQKDLGFRKVYNDFPILCDYCEIPVNELEHYHEDFDRQVYCPICWEERLEELTNSTRVYNEGR